MPDSEPELLPIQRPASDIYLSAIAVAGGTNHAIHQTEEEARVTDKRRGGTRKSAAQANPPRRRKRKAMGDVSATTDGVEASDGMSRRLYIRLPARKESES